jgi:uncharacterized phage protein gp47/JayE
VTFTRRGFPEVLSNLLTSIVGGVSAEVHPFPPPGANGGPFRHSLQHPPAADVDAVYGSRNGQPHLFRKNVDYKLIDPQTIEWQTRGAELPDSGALIYINYFPRAAQTLLTDLEVGSVVRTLAESTALEIARLYAQLEAVYQSGYVDTATGASLDNVVALLGIERVRGGRASGDIEFTRAGEASGTISIPAGTRVITADGEIEYATTKSVQMAPGQTVIRVAARDVESNEPLPADALTVLPLPIAGIASVTNPAPTTPTARDESDEEVRARAKHFLHGSERATLAAIQQELASEGVQAEVKERLDEPGFVDVIPTIEGAMLPEVRRRLETAIALVKPAGVRVELKQPVPPRRVNLGLLLTTASGLLEQDLRTAHRAVRDSVEAFLAAVPIDENGSLNRLVGSILSVPTVQDVRVLSATWSVSGAETSVLNREAGTMEIAASPTVLGDLTMADPNLATQVTVTITFPPTAVPADAPSIQAALVGAFSYLNNLNAADLAPGATDPRRAVSFGKLLFAIPLPLDPALKPTGSLVSLETGPLPVAFMIEPYAVQFVFTDGTGLSHILERHSDVYTLTPFERLALASVEVDAARG